MRQVKVARRCEVLMIHGLPANEAGRFMGALDRNRSRAYHASPAAAVNRGVPRTPSRGERQETISPRRN